MLRVEIEWIDSGEMDGEGGWQGKDQIVEKLNNVPVLTVGWLMHEDPEMLVVVHTYDPKGDVYLGPIAIQRKNINRISVLRSRKDYNADTFFYESKEATPEGGSDPDTLGGSTNVRGSVEPFSGDNVHWHIAEGSEDAPPVTRFRYIP